MSPFGLSHLSIQLNYFISIRRKREKQNSGRSRKTFYYFDRGWYRCDAHIRTCVSHSIEDIFFLTKHLLSVMMTHNIYY